MNSLEMPQKPWRQLAFVLGEAALSLVSGGVVFIIISRVAGPEVLGTYALALAWLMLFQGVSSFGVPEFLMREVGTHGRDAAGQVVIAMLLGLGSGFLALCLMLLAVRFPGYAPQVVQVITVASLALIPASINTACRAVFLALREMQLNFLAVVIEVTIVVSASLYLLLSGYGATALMVALVVAKVMSASIAAALLYGQALPVRPPLDLGSLAPTARTVLIFGIGSLLSMLTMRINTVLASLWVDIVALGHFAAATKITEIGMVIPSLFVQLLMTRIAHRFNMHRDRDPNRFGAWYQVLFAIVMPTCVGGWVFADLILDTLFGKGFADAAWVLRIMMTYLAIESVDAVMSATLIAAHRQREDVSRLAFNPLTNIVLSLVLLPILGTVGAAIGRVGGACASASLRHQLIARELTTVNWLHFALKPALISVAAGSLSYWVFGAHRPVALLFYLAVTVALLKISASFSFSTVRDMMIFPSGRADFAIGEVDQRGGHPSINSE